MNSDTVFEKSIKKVSFRYFKFKFPAFFQACFEILSLA